MKRYTAALIAGITACLAIAAPAAAEQPAARTADIWLSDLWAPVGTIKPSGPAVHPGGRCDQAASAAAAISGMPSVVEAWAHTTLMVVPKMSAASAFTWPTTAGIGQPASNNGVNWTIPASGYTIVAKSSACTSSRRSYILAHELAHVVEGRALDAAGASSLVNPFLTSHSARFGPTISRCDGTGQLSSRRTTCTGFERFGDCAARVILHLTATQYRKLQPYYTRCDNPADLAEAAAILSWRPTIMWPGRINPLARLGKPATAAQIVTGATAAVTFPAGTVVSYESGSTTLWTGEIVPVGRYRLTTPDGRVFAIDAATGQVVPL